MSAHEEGDSILLRTLGNDLRDYAVPYTRRTRCKIFSCIKYSSNYRYHQINIRNVCILPDKVFYVFRVIYKRQRLFRDFRLSRRL